MEEKEKTLEEQQVEETAVEETNNQTSGLPTTEEDFKRSIQSASSKAKNEILKEIGIEKIADIKALIEKGNMYEEIINEREALLKEKEDAENRLKEITNESVNIGIENGLLKIGLQTKRLERAKSIIINDIAKGVELNKAIENIVEEFPEWLGGVGTIGADLDPDNSTLTEREKYYKDMGYTNQK